MKKYIENWYIKDIVQLCEGSIPAIRRWLSGKIFQSGHFMHTTTIKHRYYYALIRIDFSLLIITVMLI